VKSPQINPFSSNYRQMFGNSYVRQFSVYMDTGEKIGQVVDIQVDTLGQFQNLVVALFEPASKQVLLPLRQTRIDQQRQRIYVVGLSKSEVANLSSYDSRQAISEHEYFDQNLETRVEPAVEPDRGTTVRLHEERLVVDRNQRRKVGEVIVRKEIETHMIEVPVRREKLIVEQVSPVYEQLAVVDIQSDQTDSHAIADQHRAAHTPDQPSVVGEFTSAESASRFLDAIAHHPNAKPEKIQIKIVLQDATEQATYQQWLERYLT